MHNTGLYAVQLYRFSAHCEELAMARVPFCVNCKKYWKKLEWASARSDDLS